MLSIRKCPAFETVAAGKKAVLTIDPGIRIHRLTLKVGNAAVAGNDLNNGETSGLETSDLLDDVIVKYKTKPVRTHSAVELDHLNRLNGSRYAHKSYGTAGQADRVHHLDIWFANPWRLDAAERFKPAWSLVKEPLQIEVFIKAGLAAPTLEAEMEIDAIPEGTSDIGLIQKVYRDDITVVGTTKKLQNLAKTDLYEAVHFQPTVGGTVRYVDTVKWSRNGYEDIESIGYRENRSALLAWGLNPDTVAVPWYELVLDRTDRLKDGMLADGLRTLYADLTFSGSAAGTMTMLTQRTGPPD